MTEEPLLQVRDLRKWFPVRGGLLRRRVGHVRAVDGVTFDIPEGRTLGLVGESGCGKTTVARTILRLLDPTGGSIRFQGREMAHAPRRSLRDLRPRMQIVFQDPLSSLNPRMTIRQTLGEPLRIQGVTRAAARERVADLLEKVGLREDHADRYPHEFSGGQRQRIGIARALATDPSFVVLDEPTSALDVSVQAQILNLLLHLQRELHLTYLFVSHDLSVIRHTCDQVAVMYLGKVVEQGPVEEVFRDPRHPYTQALFSAVPVPDPDRRVQRVILQGDVPSPVNPPAGCRFHPRCPRAEDHCSGSEPALEAHEPGHRAACFRPGRG